MTNRERALEYASKLDNYGDVNALLEKAKLIERYLNGENVQNTK